MRLIDATDAENWAREHILDASEKYAVLDFLRDCPAISSDSLVKRGRWVPYGNEADRGFHYCSECRIQAFNYEAGGIAVEELTKCCYNCGALMED